MRLTTRIHGTTDLLLAALLLALPWVLGFGTTPAGWTATAAGGAVAVNALLTDFEIGRLRLVSIPVHLWIDGILGLFLAASPWLLEFDRTAWVPHVAAGVLLVVLAVFTQTVPGYDRRGTAAARGG